MTFDESRGNTTATEALLGDADAHADTRETPADNRPIERRVADGWWETLHAEAAAKPVPDDVDHDEDDWSPWDDDDGECPDDDEPDPYGFDFGGADGSEF